MELQLSRRLQAIPAVDRVLADPRARRLEREYSRPVVLDCVRRLLGEWRERIRTGAWDKDIDQDGVAADVLRRLPEFLAIRECPHLRRVINATGIVLHTNLGRAVLPRQAIRAVVSAAQGYSNLEFDLEHGARGSRHSHVAALLQELTGAEAAAVVNNNAAAVLLTISALAAQTEVVVSRGQQVEIGGSFRIPDIVRQSGAALVEVGTTNKTKISDYREAIGEKTGALLHIHTSNFRVVGFTQAVSLPELAELGRDKDLPVISDLGSGSLVGTESLGASDEPTVQACVQAGVDVVTFSGDKLLGGPQAGIIVGRKRYIDKIKAHPLARVVRTDKLTLAALEAVLRLYKQQRHWEEIPTLQALFADEDELYRRAQELAEALKRSLAQDASVQVRPDLSEAGGGSLPGIQFSGWAVVIAPKRPPAQDLQRKLREQPLPVIARVHKDQLFLNVRTLLPGDSEAVSEAVNAAMGAGDQP